MSISPVSNVIFPKGETAIIISEIKRAVCQQERQTVDRNFLLQLDYGNIILVPGESVLKSNIFKRVFLQ